MKRISLTLLAGAALFAVAPAAYAADLLVNNNGPQMPGFVDMGGGGGWDGAYIGGFIGYGWGDASQAPGDILFDSDPVDLSGWTAGATLGANFTVGSGFVLGAAGDIAWSGVGGYDVGNGVDFDINWTGALRGRAGFDAGAFMPYLTAGLAVAGATASDEGVDNTQVHIGWTAGAGVEIAATDNLSFDLQYRYSDYGTADYDLPLNDATIDVNTHAVTAGLNFKF